MRRSTLMLRVLAGSAPIVGALVACGDLFHATSDVRTACENDAALCAPPPPDVCAASTDEAKQRADRACAWLAACESPMGRNAAGTCLLQARMAYDCASNPSHPARGNARNTWTCLLSAASCEQVHDCLIPSGERLDCQSVGTQCVSAPEGLRVACTDAGSFAESCSLWGLGCTASTGTCGPPFPAGCSSEGGLPTSCVRGFLPDGLGGQLGCSVDGGPLAFDCSQSGAQTCNIFDGGRTWLACDPVDDGGECSPSLAATCDAGVASTCPAGRPEALNCGALLGNPAACTPGLLDPPFDWTSICVPPTRGCTVDTCLDAGPDAQAAITACVRGVPVRLDCPAPLGGCRMVMTDAPNVMRPACGAP